MNDSTATGLSSLSATDDPACALRTRWEHGEQPDLDAFLASLGHVPPQVLVEICQVDLRFRRIAGRPVSASSYLERFPAIAEEHERAFALVYSEYLLREDLGEKPDPERYAAEYPELAERLRLQLEIHKMVDLGLTVRSLSDMMPLQPDARLPLIPGFEVLAQIGRGGMGVVYKARDLKLGRVIALKTIHPEVSPGADQLARFRLEAEAIAAIQHPNVVQIHDVVEREGNPCLELEFVSGGNLAQRIATAPLQPAEAAALIETVARAVHEAHRLGVIHRDLKPANILLTADGAPKISDFGLAKYLHTDNKLTGTEAFLGSPCYMAPEQADGDSARVGPAADVYALGVVLYEALTGRPPFKASTAFATLEQVRSSSPVPPSRLQPELSRDLETICLKCLHKEPSRRYVTAEALADDLARFRAGKPVLARPVGRLERSWRWCRRRPVVAGLAAAVVILSTALAVGGTVAVVRIANALAVTRQEKRKLDAALAKATDSEKAMKDALERSSRDLQRALRAERTAKAEAAKASAINAFLTDDVLGQAEPAHNAANKDIRLSEVIDRAADKVGQRFKDEPALEDHLRRTIALTYHELGAYPKAEAQWRAIIASAKKRGKSAEATRFEAQAHLGHILFHLDRNDEAVTLMSEALPAMERTHGRTHDFTIAARDNLAKSLIFAHRNSEALALLETNLTLRTARHGPTHVSVLTGRNNLASSYHAVGRSDDAIKLLEATISLGTIVEGPEKPSTLAMRCHLAAIFADLGRHDNAATIYRKVYPVAKRVLGPRHPNTLNTALHFAYSLESIGRAKEAKPLRQDVLTARLATEPPTSSRIMEAYDDLGHNLLLNGEWPAAEANLRLCLARRRRDQPDFWHTFFDMSQLGQALLHQKRYAQAEPLLIQGFEGVMKRRDRVPNVIRQTVLDQIGERILNLYEIWKQPRKLLAWQTRLGRATLPDDVFAPPLSQRMSK